MCWCLKVSRTTYEEGVLKLDVDVIFFRTSVIDRFIKLKRKGVPTEHCLDNKFNNDSCL